jgi:hypothetical protein
MMMEIMICNTFACGPPGLRMNISNRKPWSVHQAVHIQITVRMMLNTPIPVAPTISPPNDYCSFSDYRSNAPINMVTYSARVALPAGRNVPSA